MHQKLVQIIMNEQAKENKTTKTRFNHAYSYQHIPFASLQVCTSLGVREKLLHDHLFTLSFRSL